METDGQFEVDGVKLAYHLAGTGPYCLVHPGGPGIHYEYLRLPELEQHLTLVYVEPVGTGHSDLLPSGEYTVTQYADHAARLIQHLGADKAYFLGHSHGGFVALQLALDHPEHLHGVIVYDSMAFSGQELHDAAGLKVDQYVAARPGDPLAQQVLEAWQEDADLPPTKEAQIDNLQRLLPVYFKDYPAIVDRLADWLPTLDLTVDPNRKPSAWDIRDRLGEISVPTLILSGVADFICGAEFARQLHDAIPGSELVSFAESGHFAHLEEPEAFQQAVIKFTASH